MVLHYQMLFIIILIIIFNIKNLMKYVITMAWLENELEKYK